MKSAVKIILLLVMLSACSDKTGIELLKPITEAYPSIEDFNRIESIIVSKDNIEKMRLDLKAATESLNGKIDFMKECYILFINEKGKIDKVLVLESGSNQLADLLLPYMKNWEFEIIQKSTEPQKYRLEWKFNLNKNSIGKFDLTGSNIPIPIEKDGEQFYITADEMPQPIGGIAAIQQNVNYPELAKRAGIQGRVFVKALVNKDGIVVDTDIIRGIEGGCNEAAMSAVRAIQFTPARYKGEAVNAQVIVPILFRLQ